MFRNVQLRVKQTIGQDPWLSFPSLPAVYFAGTKPTENVELTFWAAVKDSTSPAVLNTYLQRYPNGEFASIARALIERYERQLKAEQAAREEERKRQEEVRKSAELKRLEEERLVREAALAQERRNAEVTSNVTQLRLMDEQQRTELAKRTAELHNALEEARLAREAAKAAEDRRLAAVKAAEEATKAAEAAISAKQADLPDERMVVAALPKLDPPRQNFDGNWTFHVTTQTCPRAGSFKAVIRGTTATWHDHGQTVKFRIDPSGVIRGTMLALADGAPIDWSGRLQGNSGSGKFGRRDGGCGGVFTARRN